MTFAPNAYSIKMTQTKFWLKEWSKTISLATGKKCGARMSVALLKISFLHV
jgi:hypothetical protein